MSTSGSKDFELDVADYIEEAFERCGLEVRTGYDLKTAKRSLNLMTMPRQRPRERRHPDGIGQQDAGVPYAPRQFAGHFSFPFRVLLYNAPIIPVPNPNPCFLFLPEGVYGENLRFPGLGDYRT